MILCSSARQAEALLSVVHISEDGMSFMEPLEVTDTHVVVEVLHLSAFGLVWDLVKRFLTNTDPVTGQILLFLRPPNPKTQRKNLNVLLLPSNIHLEEVKMSTGLEGCPQNHLVSNSESYKVTSGHMKQGEDRTANPRLSDGGVFSWCFVDPVKTLTDVLMFR